MRPLKTIPSYHNPHHRLFEIFHRIESRRGSFAVVVDDDRISIIGFREEIVPLTLRAP